MTLQQSETLLPGRRWDWQLSLQRLGPLVALIALVAFAAWQSEGFLTWGNILNILRNNSFVGILALGMTFVIILGGIDLSVGSLLALAGGTGVWVMNTAVSAAEVLRRSAEDPTAYNADSAFRVWLAGIFTSAGVAGSHGWAMALAIATILLVGVIGGALNGLLIARGRLAPFIVTLGAMAAFRSLILTMTDASAVVPQARGFDAIGNGGITIPFLLDPLGRPVQVGYPVVVFLTLVLALWVVLRRTRYGRYVVAIGSNEKAAIYSAIHVKRIKLMTYTLMGGLAGIAALLQSSKFNGVTSSSTGHLAELDAIAAVAIGGTSMRGGSGTILGTLIGVLLLGVVGNMLTMLNVSPYLQGLVKGAIVIGAALLQRGREGE